MVFTAISVKKDLAKTTDYSDIEVFLFCHFNLVSA